MLLKNELYRILMHGRQHFKVLNNMLMSYHQHGLGMLKIFVIFQFCETK